jgi:hypothetical protein
VPHVFLSYVREDSSKVKELRDALIAEGITVWIDKECIMPGELWPDAIRRAIRESDFFMACFSRQYVKRTRTYAYKELNIAIKELSERSKEMAWFIPIYLDDCHTPDRSIGGEETLADIQRVDLFDNWDAGLVRILSVLKNDNTFSTKHADSDLGNPGPIRFLNEPVDAKLEAVTLLKEKLIAGELWGNASAWASVSPGRIDRTGYENAAEVAAAALRSPATRAEAKTLMRHIAAERRWQDDPVGVDEIHLAGAFTIQNIGPSPVMVRIEEISAAPFFSPEWEELLLERLPQEPLMVPRRNFVVVSTSVLGDPARLIPQDKAEYHFKVVLRIASKLNVDFSDVEQYPKDQPDEIRWGAVSCAQIEGVQQWAASDALKTLIQGAQFQVPIALRIDSRREERHLALRVDLTCTNTPALTALAGIRAPKNLKEFLERWLAVVREGCKQLWHEHSEDGRKHQHGPPW